jgi:D-xylose reductase
MDADRTVVELDKVSTQETWQALEELVDEGVCRSIGVSNFSTQLLYDVLSYARHPISSLQIETHPYLVQSQLVNMAQEEGIVITGYSTFGPQSFLELPPTFSKKAADTPMLLQHKLVAGIAEKHQKTAAQVLLRWATQRSVPSIQSVKSPNSNENIRGIAVIPKSNNKARLEQNLDVISFDLTDEELQEISGLDCGLRFNDPGEYLPKQGRSRPIRIFG